MPAPASSAARVAANRLNSLRSTGPRTEAGKERSRANAVKHGLTGAGIALPDEDRAAIAERFQSVHEELAPETTIGRILADQVALASVRMDRAARHEAAAIACRMRAATTAHDEAQGAEVDRLFAQLDTDPRAAWPRLTERPDGVARLMTRLIEIKFDLLQPGLDWTEAHERLVEACCGRVAGQVPETRATILSRALRGDFTRVAPGEIAGLATDTDRRRWAIARMAELIDDEVTWLTEIRQTFDRRALDVDRAEATTRAIFAVDRDSILARRYEAAATRTFFRALRDFQALEARDEPAADLPPAPASAAPPPAPGRPPAERKPLPRMDFATTLASFSIQPSVATTPAGSPPATGPIVPTPARPEGTERPETAPNRPN